MKIDNELVRKERNRRGWTQQHLAELCDCSLRTIQRVENQGLASHESISALCAVMELNRERLLGPVPTREDSGTQRRMVVLIGLAATLGGFSGALAMWLLMSSK